MAAPAQIACIPGEDNPVAGSPPAAAAHLGIKLLVSLFGAVPSGQEELLRAIQSKLVGVKEEKSLPFVATLAKLVHRYPKAVLEHAEILKVCFASQHDLSLHALHVKMGSTLTETGGVFVATGVAAMHLQ